MLPGVTSLPTPIAKSTHVTHASHMPTLETERDIIQPIASEEARAAYFKERMKNMGGTQTTFQYSIQGGSIKHIHRFNEED